MARTHAPLNPRSPMAGLRPVDGIAIFTARGRAMTRQVSVSDTSYLRLTDLAWDLRQAARQNGLTDSLSQLIVVLGFTPQLWVNGAFRIEADPLQERYRVTRQIDEVREIILECADPATIVDFVLRHIAGPHLPETEARA